MQGNITGFNLEDSEQAKKGAIFFAVGIVFLVIAGTFGFSNPTLAIVLAILCAISLTIGMYLLSPDNKDSKNNKMESAGFEQDVLLKPSCKSTKDRHTGGIIFAFGIFILLSSPLWAQFTEMLIITLVTGGVIMAYGLYRIVN
ncbi:hypothetical protein BEH94_01710 [Candidatus Altiarchaeales archaeon WOR_SM1_SCG]|nr:hypothetical protein BEH94_01710 [Candidatus Altiarchaeales archaeon WOR_SM1_SCG]